MRPPICDICGKKAEHLVYFRLPLIEKIKEMFIKYPHHPPNAVWLCEKHFKIIKNIDYRRMSAKEGVEYIISQDRQRSNKNK